MGMRRLEADILAELRRVENKHSIRQKDIMEWQLGPSGKEPQEGEARVILTIYGNQKVTVWYKCGSLDG